MPKSANEGCWEVVGCCDTIADSVVNATCGAARTGVIVSIHALPMTSRSCCQTACSQLNAAEGQIRSRRTAFPRKENSGPNRKPTATMEFQEARQTRSTPSPSRLQASILVASAGSQFTTERHRLKHRLLMHRLLLLRRAVGRLQRQVIASRKFANLHPKKPTFNERTCRAGNLACY